MNKGLKYLLQLCIFLILKNSGSFSQPVQEKYFNLNLSDSGRIIENRIILEIPASDFEAMRSTTGQKISLKCKKLVINSDTVKPEQINTRGQTTLQFRRKSLGMTLYSEASLKHGMQTGLFKKFSVLNLAMDKYYSHNRLAFGMMEEAGTFDLFYSFCELRINGSSEGIFMAIERPEDWAMIKEKSPLILRRGYGHKIDKIKSDKKIDRSETKKYLDYYREIYRSLKKYEGEELYNNLSVWLDMENYMRLLAFNFLVRNGDYSDEVFFYIDPEINKFRVIPWDYDDIFALAPHEGKDESKKIIGDRLIFSAEDLLDRKVATDPFLYESYLKCLNDVLEKLSQDVLKMVFEETFAELYPYYSDREIISNVQYDHFRDASIENLKKELTTLFIGLTASRDRWLNYLKSSNK